MVSDVVVAHDYYPYGLPLPGREITEESYRFGFQGEFSEEDEETGWNSFESRMWDPVISRWLVVDPQRQFASPYLGMGNNPVNGVDPDGELFFGLFGSTSAQRQAARRDAAATGGEILGLLSKDISVITEGNFYLDPVKGYNTATGHVFTTSYAKDGSVSDYNIQEITMSTLATGAVNFDPLTQLTLGFATVGGASAMARVSFSTLASDVSAATTYAYVKGSALVGRGVGYVGAGYFYTGYRLFGDKFTRLHPRLFTQTDIGHRAATFLRSDFLRQFPKVSNWNTIYWQTSQGNGYFHIGANPWTRTIFHEGYGHRPFGN